MRLLHIVVLLGLAVTISTADLPVYSTCQRSGNYIDSARGYVTSPNYPGEYSADLVCQWTIVSSRGAGIRITIEHLDNKELYDGGSEICNDKLRIASGKSGGTFTNIHKDELCAKKVDELRKKTFDIENSGGDVINVRISFTSDYSDHSTGFSIFFESLCNQTQEGLSGVLQSLNYPQKYPNNAECVTVINAPVDHKIEIEFKTLKVEDQKNCETDYVVISEGPPGQYGSRPKKYCKGDAGIVTVDASIATVKFITDKHLGGSGYEAHWTAVSTTTSAPTTTIEYDVTTAIMKNCSYTNESTLCQRWDTHVPHRPKYTPKDVAHNFCRNPDGDSNGVWCYTTDPGQRWQYCDLDNCVATTTTESIAEVTTTNPTTTTTEQVTTTPEPTTTTPEPTTTTPKITTDSQEVTTDSFTSSVGGRLIVGITPGKQVSGESEGGVHWGVYIAIPVMLILLILLVVFLVRRKRQRKAEISVNGPSDDTVTFGHMDDLGERPRENTYVEIPFLGEVHESRRNRVPDSTETQDSCGKNFVLLNNRGSKNSSVSSHDSVAFAKEVAQRNFSTINHGASTSDANPYSVAEDISQGSPMPNGGQNATTSQGATAENVYHAITGPQTEKKPSSGNSFVGAPLPPTPIERQMSKEKELGKESSKKKGKQWKLKKSSKKTGEATTGFANPSYQENKNVPQNVKKEEEERNPFDSDEEPISPPFSPNKSRNESQTLEYDNSIYNAPSMIPAPPQPDEKETIEVQKQTMRLESPYMAPKLSMPNKVPENAAMVSMSPEIIDYKEQQEAEGENSVYQSPNPTSPVFDLPENFIYDAPRETRSAGTSFSSNKSDGDSTNPELFHGSSSGKSGRDSGNASLTAIDSIGEDQPGHEEYCTMNSIQRMKKSQQTNKEENRRSNLYLEMKSFQSVRHVSESSAKQTLQQTTVPRKSL